MSATVQAVRILVVDDEMALARALCETLTAQGYVCTHAGGADEALERLRAGRFDVLLTDLMMPGMGGVELIGAALRIDPHLACVIMTGQGTIRSAVEAMKVGALDYVLKPVMLHTLIPVLVRALEISRLRSENVQLREMLAIHEVSGAVAATYDVAALLERIVEAACHHGTTDDVCVLLAVSAGRELEVKAARGAQSHARLGRRVPVTQALKDWAERCRQMLARPSADIDPTLVLEHPLRELCPGMVMPMLAGGELVGVLRLTPAASAHPPSIGQLRGIGILASEAASALKAASLVAELEERVRARTAELEQANRDLEAFSYSVSHDLMQPLRAVRGFAAMLRDADFAALSPDGRHNLSRVIAGGEQMDALIRGLLDFARCGRAVLEETEVDPAALARSVAQELAAEYPTARFTIGELPRGRGDPVLLRQVFANLLSNALKYSAKRAQPLVEIGVADTPRGRALFVRDNGVGFDMRYADKLFGVFSRLHSRAEYEGAGVGLAIAARIVERHGGRIWAEAAEDRGASFYFTLPALAP